MRREQVLPGRRRTERAIAWVLALCLAGCSDESGSNDGPDVEDGAGDVLDAPVDGDAPEPDASAEVAPDGDEEGVADAADAGDGDPDGEPVALEYVRTYPQASSFPAPSGQVWRRAIIHLHSTHSHDACDGDPRPDGAYNLPCLADLRAALCRVHVDFAYLTDHHVHMAEPPFEDLLLYDAEAGDALVFEGEGEEAVAWGNRITCDDGFVVTTTVGMETSLMPVGFRGHLDPDFAVRDALLSGSDAAAVERFRVGGAFVLTAHTEGKTTEEVLALGLDGLEMYNLHANIDPRIRQEDLHLESADIFGSLLPFVLQRVDTSPDLALLGFVEQNQPALETWAVALAAGPMVGTAGTDAHQNVLPPPMADGERFDSYRRMMAWFSNYVLAADASLEAFDAGLRAGRLFVGFDTLGDPAGFDCAARVGEGPRVEMGGSVALADGLSLVATIPEPAAVDGEAAAVRALVLRVADGGWETVAEWAPGERTLALDGPGIYRVEVRITPRQLRPYLDPTLRDLAEREMPWIYGNPIRVTE